MNFATGLAVEAWTLWSIGIILVICRMSSRLIVLGSPKKLQLTFTRAVVSTMQVADNGSNYLPDGAAEQLTPDEVVSAIYGSKMTLVLEEFSLFTTWQIKTCLLLMYSRLTLGLKQNLAVKVLAGYCVLGFVVTQILYLAVWCQPIQQYWAVPVMNSQCASYHNHMITATAFNVSSDLMMLLIPIPLLINAQLPLKRKIILCCVFSLGIFVILAAVLNRYYYFSIPFSPIFFNWYICELSTAVFVANIPLCWPLLRRIFRLGTFGDKRRGGKSSSYLSPWPIGNGYATKNSMRSSARHRLPSSDGTVMDFGESEERINRDNNWPIRKEHIVLSPMEARTSYKTLVQAGKDGESSDHEYEVNAHDVGITKTIQVTQYTL